MKLTLTLCFFLLFSKLALAVPSPILACLAQEELNLHKSKNTGPVYNLNQTLVNQIATIPNLKLSRENLDLVCSNKLYGPSLSLLRLIILEGKKIFSIKKGSAGHGLAMGQLGTFVETSPHIMFDYLNEIQALMPYAHCLTDEIPEVKYFYDRYKYLEQDLNGYQLIQDKNKIDRIFIGLSKMDQILKSCKARAKKLAEEEEKGTVKR